MARQSCPTHQERAVLIRDIALGGLVLTCFSAQNIDRFGSCGAPGRTGRPPTLEPTLASSAHGRAKAGYSTVSFSLGAETRRVLVSALGLGRSRKRVRHHAKSTPTSSRASERPHGQATSMTATTR